ncbi:MAG: DUF5320 domain-containing protein [Deltaproteobacteria bacterium]|nr:DUF5320 domain-containing protein [Deltaproteobacteria bacterium]
MPRGDKTGLSGQGPMTGRGAGPCASGSPKGRLSRQLTGNSRRSGFLSWFGLGFGRSRGGFSGQGTLGRWFKR